jgi:hypothetical protein
VDPRQGWVAGRGQALLIDVPVWIRPAAKAVHGALDRIEIDDEVGLRHFRSRRRQRTALRSDRAGRDGGSGAHGRSTDDGTRWITAVGPRATARPARHQQRARR